MSIIKGLIVKPRPCPFCGGKLLELKAVLFRHWNIHCLNNFCLCKGPDGKTPDLAVIKWNSLEEDCISQRKQVSQLVKDYRERSVAVKIWKAARTLRDFTIKGIIRITGCHKKTVILYLSLLEKNEYLKKEQKGLMDTDDVRYRCIRPRVVKAPPWLSLQLSPREYQEYKKERKSLAWKRIEATTD